MTVSINISGLEPIAGAINNLAQALGSKGVTARFNTGEGSGPAGQQALPSGGPEPAAGPGGFPAAGGSPGVPAPGVQTGWTGSMPHAGSPQPSVSSTAGPLPTTAAPQAYTQDRIAVAMTGLVDQGKQPQVMQILAQFGAASLMQVSKEQYPALAAQLRALGAAI